MYQQRDKCAVKLNSKRQTYTRRLKHSAFIYRKDATMIKINIYELLCLCDKLSHRVDEQNETIEYYQNENKHLKNMLDISDDARIDLIKEIKKLEKENTNLRKNIDHLCDENIRLRHELNEVKSDANNKIY